MGMISIGISLTTLGETNLQFWALIFFMVIIFVYVRITLYQFVCLCVCLSPKIYENKKRMTTYFFKNKKVKLTNF